MKYRQWKKNYKKLHGVNPPLELDKRKQRKLAKKAIKNIGRIDFAAVATRAAEAFTNAAARKKGEELYVAPVIEKSGRKESE